MSVVIFGQPCSGKTTLANRFADSVMGSKVVRIDGDDLRRHFKNTDYSKSGRMLNLKIASQLSSFIVSKNMLPVLSLMYPYLSARDYMRECLPNTKWIFLEYDPAEKRGREEYHAPDFEEPTADEMISGQMLILNTSKLSIQSCTKAIIEFVTTL